MNPIRTGLLYLAALAAACASLVAQAAELTVNIQGVARAEGTLQIAVYDSEAKFRKEMFRAIKLPAAAGTMTLRVPDLPAGDYAVMVFHDLNGNDKLDTNLLGIPKEPWGASIGEKSVLGAPGWNDARITLTDAGASVTINLR